jgi:branched-subunit amino acid aminotransferase/4-amino-4-deoxychorismate lyase
MANPEQNFGFPGFWYDGAWRSGDQITLDITDPGLLYGATVFTTLRIYENLADARTAWAAHRSRLTQSLEEFGWTMPDWHLVETGIGQITDPVVRVTIFPDGREFIVGRALPADLPQRQTQGIIAVIADHPIGARSLPHHKTGNYLTPWFGLHHARSIGAQETILTDTQGHWLETCTGSLWGWAEGIWYTPPVNAGILPGIRRDRIISGLRCQNREVLESPWTPALIDSFRLLAYSNCVVEIIPIVQVRSAAKIWEYPINPAVLAELQSGLTVS